MKITIYICAAILFSSILFSSCTDNNQPTASSNAQPTLSTDDLIKKGEYLVTTIGCNDCHSPKRMGERGPEVIPELMLSGYPGDRPVPKASADALKKGWGLLNSDFTSFVGPWGESFAGNLTSDPTGIGNWTEEQFKKAITQGKFKGVDGGRMLLPPMPWTNWANLKDGDVKAIFLYLKSTPPVRNIVPAPIPPNELFADE